MKAIILLVVLTSAALAQNDAAIARAKAACGPDNVMFDMKTNDDADAVAQPATGKALVYVIGEGPNGFACRGCGIVARVGVNGAWVGAINGASHLSFPVDPGDQHLCVNWQSVFSGRSGYVALGNLNAEAGKVYYFRMRVLIQGEKAATLLDLDPLNSDEGKYMVATSKLATSTVKK